MSFADHYPRWLKSRTPRKCQRCGKEYLPTGFTQKFCPDCKNISHPNCHCQKCGRFSKFTLRELDGKKLCSFCYSAQRKLEYTLKIQKQQARFKCSKCGAPITFNEKRAFRGKCEHCYFEVEVVEKYGTNTPN
jgi:DNA-directed RNA polymerase subunit RPC12/RpoP